MDYFNFTYLLGNPSIISEIRIPVTAVKIGKWSIVSSPGISILATRQKQPDVEVTRFKTWQTSWNYFYFFNNNQLETDINIIRYLNK